MSDERFQITGQCVDIKRLKATGGWRFSLDLFDALEKDILLAASLVNRQQVVRLTIEPAEREEKSEGQRAHAETKEVRKRVSR